jgi:flap endonuclease GEN
MTVSSLWKALNSTNCGKSIGEKELSTGLADLRGVNPWNYNERVRSQTLAIDLSIWICESLTSHGLNEQNVNPTLHVVFSRTVKLLSLGIKLIFVVEGKSRIRTQSDEDDRFRKRRSGTAFWKACKQCQTMLEQLGVVVVTAKAEGEALCALLSQRGLVDGVISNDGDCLLFGAERVYTKFSLENLANGSIVRYDLDDLRSFVERSGSSDDQSSNADLQKSADMKISREDLIVFALLTGSDMAGGGLENVGHKKALRFIQKCKHDYPLSVDSAALDEMKSWARAAKAGTIQSHTCDGGEQQKQEACCSRCCHAGTKRNHRKHGCEICGTQPGEPCYKFSADDRFRQSLRSKALQLYPKFDPSKVLAAYTSPNDNQLPIQLVSLLGQGGAIKMKPPQLSELMRMDLVIKGFNLASSREYIQQAVGGLLSRYELMESAPVDMDSGPVTETLVTHTKRERPVPKSIQKSLTHQGAPCYQILWRVNGTVTDESGEGIDGYEYLTIEPCEIVEKRYPDLVHQFREEEVERLKQGDKEKQRRQKFLEDILFETKVDDDAQNRKRKLACIKMRGDFFEQKMPTRDSHDHNIDGRQSHDVTQLLRFVKKPTALSSSPLTTCARKTTFKTQQRNQSSHIPSLSPSRELFCNMGELLVPLTPIMSQRGVFPPHHILLVKNVTEHDEQ